jgi:GntR family transcriptional regulator
MKAREIADDLRERLRRGVWKPGEYLDRYEDLCSHYRCARQTIRTAVNQLRDEGWVRIVHGHGAQVLDRRPIRIPLSRYSAVLEPGGKLGPWETACAEQGRNGRMVLMGFNPNARADSHVAKMLGIATGDPVVYRYRQALVDERVHHIQHAWYPADLVAGTALAEGKKVVGGVFGLMTGLGFPPELMDEHIITRMPTKEEAGELSSGTSVPLLVIERTVRDHGGRVLELLRVIGPGDQMELHYDSLPLRRS